MNNSVKIRLLKDSVFDYSLLEKWYQEETIYSSFEQRKLTYDEIRTKYYPRTLKNAKICVYMIEYDNKPVGIIQYKGVNSDDRKLYGLKGTNIYEMDIFIGDLKEHHKGIGSEAIKCVSGYLFKEKNANILIMCPLKTNTKAINCYRKCEFYIKGYFEAKDTMGNIQDYVLMIRKK